MLLGVLQANIVAEGQTSIPGDAMGLSFYASFWLQKLLMLDHEVWARSLSLTDTRRSLVEAAELCRRVALTELKPGVLLVSCHDDEDEIFGRSVVLVYRHDARSTEGIIINKRLSLAHLSHFYPNGTDHVPRGESGETPSLMLGGPVSLRSGRRGTQLLTRGTSARHDPDAAEISDGVYLCSPR